MNSEPFRCGGWKCRRCERVVDIATHRCGCAEGPSPWEPADPVDRFGYMLKPDGAVVARHQREVIEIIRYWHAISDCVCSDPGPIGACLKCDMGYLLRTLDHGPDIP